MTSRSDLAMLVVVTLLAASSGLLTGMLFDQGSLRVFISVWVALGTATVALSVRAALKEPMR